MRLPWTASKSDRELVTTLQDVYGKDVIQLKEPGFGGMLTLIKSRVSTGPPRGQSQLLDSYATQPWVRAVVGKISEGVASAEWQVLKAPGKGADERAANAKAYSRANPAGRKRRQKAMDFEPLPNHPILDLLERGNPFHEGYVLAELTQVHQELVGEGFWLKERDGRGQPIALWNLPPSWLIQTPVPGTDVESFAVRTEGVTTKIPASEIIWFQKPSALSPYRRGVGVGHALSDEMDIDEYTAKMMKSFMLNGAIPDILVTADGLSPEATKRLEEDWIQKSQGFWRRFKPHFLNKKVEVIKLTSSFRDLELGKLRDAGRDVIVHTWGVAPEIMGIQQNSNRATIEGAFFQFSRWVLVPRLEFKRVTLQARLVPDFGDSSLVLDYVSPVEEDRAHVLEVMRSNPGSFTVDEWREEAGRGELPDGGGQVFGTQFTTRYVSELVPSSPPPGPAPGPEPEPEVQPNDEPPSSELAGRADYRRKQSAGSFVSAANDAIDPEEVDDEIRPILAAAVILFGDFAVEPTSLPAFDQTTPDVVEYLLNGYADELASVNATTKAEVEAVIRAAAQEGLALEATVDRVRGVFTRAAEVRSATIARSATTASANFGTNEGFVQAGIPLKDWISERDGKVRDTHVELDNQSPIPVDQDFVSSSGATGPRPGALGDAAEDANCRCWIAPAGFTEDGQILSAFDTEEKRTDAWKTFESMRLPLEDQAIEALGRAFGRQERAVIAALRGV